MQDNYDVIVVGSGAAFISHWRYRQTGRFGIDAGKGAPMGGTSSKIGRRRVGTQ